ncbi:hypothetical protein K504DRAFT_378126 [Pleomassaria siparia CBS 279.74]|uniref:DUF7707 domain-containing protein n=1 Tax=Pleomassaria siparia CBS 279.74 TaxID=1314801 RepID=A0A6G1KDH2_9PLEO|nr:hypothetical protein K504DRAFT_378126 [Pleomassaria siparia CBS 279.74]
MLYTTVLVAVAAISGFASAQNSTAIPCCSVPASSVPQAQRTAWCQAERNTCPEVCGGLGKVASNGNTCDDTTLNYTCTCSDKTSPNMTKYQQSVPAQMCFYWYGQCVVAAGQDALQQFQCQQARDAQCGNLTSKGTAASSSASPSGTAAATSGGGGGGSASSSAAATKASSTGGAATAFAVARDFGTPLVAGGLAALFGLAL